MNDQSKTDRLQLRIDESAKRHLEDAAGSAHLSVSSFVLQAAMQRADEVLADRALISLSASAADGFLTALHRAPEPNWQLREALERPIKVEWLD